MRISKKIMGVLIGILCLSGGLAHADEIDKIAKKISKSAQALKNQHIAVLPFPYHDGTEGEGSTIISERLVTKIASLGKVRVVERSLLERVLMELKMERSGAISQENAKELGKILGVEAILTGTLINVSDKDVEINARLINTESGLVLAAASEKTDKFWRDEARGKKQREDSIGEAPSDEKNKMSVFFHERSWQDPRYQPDASDRDKKSDLIFSNRSEYEERRDFSPLPSGETLLESPKIFMRNVFLPEQENNGIAPLEEVWQKMSNGNFLQAKEILLDLRGQLRAQRRPALASLAELYLAECDFQLGDYNQALENLRPLIKKTQWRRLKAQGLFIAAHALEGLGKFQLAQEFYREIVRDYPFENRLIQIAGTKLKYQQRPRP